MDSESSQDLPDLATDQLERYRQRDLMPSHLYRLGTRLFRSDPIRTTRRRMIDASRCEPRLYEPHEHKYLRRTWDGKPLENALRKSSPTSRHSDLSLHSINACNFTEDQYREWLRERKSVREGLEGMSISERWLCSKARTHLENKLLAELRDKRKASTATIAVTESEVKITYPFPLLPSLFLLFFSLGH